MDSLIEKIVILVGSVVAAYYLGKHTQKKDSLIDKWKGKTNAKEKENKAILSIHNDINTKFNELRERFTKRS